MLVVKAISFTTFRILLFLPLCLWAYGPGEIGALQQTVLGDWSAADSRVVLRIVDRFEPAYPKKWGLGGSNVAFKKAGDYFAPFVRPYCDSIRGNVAELNFPATRSNGMRELNCYLPPDPRIQSLSMHIRPLAGIQRITLSIVEIRPGGTFRFSHPVDLRKGWNPIRLPLDRFLCTSHPGMKIDFMLPAARILQINGGSECSVFLVDDIVAEGTVPGNVAVFRDQTAAWAFTEDEKAVLNYHVCSAVKSSFTLAIDVMNGAETVITRRVKKNGTGIMPVAVDPGNLPAGYYTVTIRGIAESNEQPATVLETDRFIVTAVKKGKPRSLIGVNISPLAYSPNNFRSLVRCRITLGRIGEFQWPDIEPMPGERSFAVTDNLYKSSSGAGFSLLPVTGYAPSWAVSPPPGGARQWKAAHIANRPPDDIGKLSEMTALIVKRYTPGITLWEFWNEPNLNRGPPFYFYGTTSEYLDCLKKTSQRLAASVPRCTLISGGIAQHKNNDIDFTSALARDSSFNYRAFGFHAYQTPEVSWNAINTLKSSRTSSDAGLYMTEVGDKAVDSDLSSVRFWNARMHRYTFEFLSQGVRHWSVHWFHPDVEPHLPGAKLLYFNGAPKLRMAAVAVMASMTDGALSIDKVYRSSAIAIYRITTADRERCVLIGAGKVRLGCKGPAVRTDMDGKRTSVVPVNGRATFLLEKDDVVYCECDAFSAIDPDNGRPEDTLSHLKSSGTAGGSGHPR